MADEQLPKRLVEREVAAQTGRPGWVAKGVLREESDPLSVAQGKAHVTGFLAGLVNRNPGLGSGAVAFVKTYELTNGPKLIADNRGNLASRYYVLANTTDKTTAELLGSDPETGDPQALGEGIPIDSLEKSGFGLPGGESVYAAAPTGDHVILRVMELQE